jgi:hypothetical protein
VYCFSNDSSFKLATALHTGALIILGRCPSLSAHESESMLRTYLVAERNKQMVHGRSTQYTNISDPNTLTSELLLRQIVSLRMLTNLKLADLRQTTAQQRTTGQDLQSDLYNIPCLEYRIRHTELLPTTSLNFTYTSNELKTNKYVNCDTRRDKSVPLCTKGKRFSFVELQIALSAFLLFSFFASLLKRVSRD